MWVRKNSFHTSYMSSYVGRDSFLYQRWVIPVRLAKFFTNVGHMFQRFHMKPSLGFSCHIDLSYVYLCYAVTIYYPWLGCVVVHRWLQKNDRGYQMLSLKHLSIDKCINDRWNDFVFQSQESKQAIHAMFQGKRQSG